MAGPSALSSLSFREGVEQGGKFDGCCGDLPHFFYTLLLPRAFARFFVMQLVTTAKLREALLAEGWSGVLPDPKRGRRVGLQVVAMGWSWAGIVACGAARSGAPPPHAPTARGAASTSWQRIDGMGVPLGPMVEGEGDAGVP